MSKTNLIWRSGMLVLVAAGIASAALAQAGTLENPVTIRIAPLSRIDAITPKSGAQLFDNDGINQSASDVVVAPFTLRAVVGGDKVEVSVPEFPVSQVQWVADPIGCMDDDPKTKCHPTWGTEYSGQVDEDLPVYVEFATGGGVFYYGSVDLVLNVTVVDNKIRSVDGYLQVSYDASTELPNVRVPVVGKLK